ncbi:MAG: 50S ribosomal protein L11 methyltransferase [Deltaproteobacteria bacterium]|nr:50S ribosomal protein L11 methyltransferase [Deltaproteobacteria bacterium]
MSQKPIKQWLESRWSVNQDASEIFHLKLQQMGCLGSYEDLPLSASKKKSDEASEVIAYFPFHKSIGSFAKQLKKLENTATKLIVIKTIPQGNWATEWKKYFKPFAIAPGIIIKPSWEKYKQKKNEAVIVLDPGMAFGTGLHDTTRFCAELICKVKKQHDRLNSLLDIGCGSGILSFIAKQSGFSTVTGVDTDCEAIETCHENLKRNPDLAPIGFFLTDGHFDHPSIQKADVIAANIIAETLCDLKTELIRLTNNNGYLVLSGILNERVDLVKKAFKDLKPVQTKKSKEWHALVYCKK